MNVPHAPVGLFEDFLAGFQTVCNDLGHVVVLRALKRHYADGCCAGDVVMKLLIAALADQQMSVGTMINLYNDWKEEDLFLTVLDNLVDTLEYWYAEGECRPNVWWAD